MAGKITIMDDTNNPRHAAWQEHRSALALRDEGRAKMAEIEARISDQEDLIAGADDHNAALIQQQIAADLDGASKPKTKPIDVNFEGAKMEALRARLADARADQTGLQGRAESTLRTARQADLTAVKTWAKETAEIHRANGRVAVEGNAVTLNDLGAAYAAHRAGGGKRQWSDWLGDVIGFHDLDASVEDARKQGLAWHDSQDHDASNREEAA